MMRLHTTDFMVTYVEEEDEGYIISAYICNMRRDLEKVHAFVRLFFPFAQVDKIKDAYHFPDANFVTLTPREPGLPMLKVFPSPAETDSYLLFPKPGYFGDLTIELYGACASPEKVKMLEMLGFTALDESPQPEVA